MKLINTIQGSEEWFEQRLGIPTASEFGKIAKRDGTARVGKMPQTYANQLLEERFCKTVNDWEGNQFTVAGTLKESQARAWYSLGIDEEVSEHGFCLSDCGRYGYSPDALVGESGLLEIKCPKASTHIGRLLDNKIPDDYWMQCHGGMMVTGRQWIDFLDYHEDLPALVVRVQRSEVTENLKATVEAFCDDLDIKEKQIRAAA